MAGSLQDLQRLLDKAVELIPKQTATIIGVEGKNFIQKNFQDQGFNDGSLQKWKERKTTDSKGLDKMRYRTNRRGQKGELTKFGKKEIGRAILTGHETGGDKLRNSLRYRTINSSNDNIAVRFFTYKGYAEYHNEGTDDMPARPFMKPSQYLNNKISEKIQKTLDKLFR